MMMNDKDIRWRMNSSLQKCNRNQYETITQSGNKTLTSFMILWGSKKCFMMMNDENIRWRMNSSLQKCKRNQYQTITQSGNKTLTSFMIL